jgi:molybdopterin converting factor small subunit
VRIEVISWVNKLVGGPGTSQVVLEEELRDGSTVRSVLRQVGARFPELNNALWDPTRRTELGDNIEVLVNDAVLGVSHELDSKLVADDRITLLGQYMGG